MLSLAGGIFGVLVVALFSYVYLSTASYVQHRLDREIEADRSGYVESDDVAGTTRLLQRWIDTALTERETMRQNARSCFEQRFEIDRAVDSLLQVLSEVPDGQ